MSATSPTTAQAGAATTQVYKVYIKASPDRVWQGITDPEWTNRYGYTGYHHYDLKPGGSFRVLPNDELKAAMEAQGYPCPESLVDGEVLEADPPRKLVTTWRMLMDPTTAAEPFTTISYEIEDLGGFCALTVVHQLEGAPATATMVSSHFDADSGGGGWAWILADLKTLLETGERMTPFDDG
jgi:uncharacterized protein YndB with AHSA1/START domain